MQESDSIKDYADKESDSIKGYADRLKAILNKIRLLGEELTDRRIVEKVLVSLPERFESKISSFEDSRDHSKISFTELINALEAQEQRRAIQQEVVEGAFQAKMNESEKSNSTGRKQGGEESNQAGDLRHKKGASSSKDGGNKGKYPPCLHCKKTSHSKKYCWFRPDIKCRSCKQMGHMERVCKNKQQGHQAQVAENELEQEGQLFVATCFAINKSNDAWLIDSGCSHQRTSDASMFRELDRTCTSKVRIGNGDSLEVKGRGVVAVETPRGTKLISDVLYVPEIDQNLLSVVSY